MRHLSIILFVGLIAVSSLALYMLFVPSQEPADFSTHFDSVLRNQTATMVPGSASFLLVGDNFENYDIYKYNSNRSPSSDLQTYYDLYGIPIYELYKNWLRYGGYIGSPLYRSKRELYNDCLMRSRYTYECQRGEQR
jgi:hypothetical protein